MYDTTKKSQISDILESISARNELIPPLIIFNAVMHQATWYKNDFIPLNWFITVSKNG